MTKKNKIDLNIFKYTEYRKYLCDYYKKQKQETSYFSHRYFSKQAGFTSPNYFKLIMDGDRNLSGEAINKFTKALKLKPKEARYFRLMVLMNQASTSEEREFYTRQVLKSKGHKAIKPLNQVQYDYYSQWFHIPLRELVARSDFINDPNWIAHQFLPALTENQVKEGIKTLLKLGLIEETKEGGYQQTDKTIASGDAVTTQAVANFHRQMIQKGAESIDRIPSKDRDVSCLTMGTTEKTAKQIKEMIQEFKKEIAALVEADEKIEEVIQLNFQLFPLTKKVGEKDEK